jgi:hypothetical protein
VETLSSTLKRGLLLLFVLTALGLFIAKNCYEIYTYLPKISSSPTISIFIYLVIINLLALTLGYLSNKISLFVNIFFRKLGNEAFLAINNGERIYPMITAGEIKLGETEYYVCYRASMLWVLSMPAEFIKKSSPYLVITERSAVSALWSAAQYYNDQNPASKKS